MLVKMQHTRGDGNRKYMSLRILERRTTEPTPNQPMERTLPRCALQRRSSAR